MANMLNRHLSHLREVIEEENKSIVKIVDKDPILSKNFDENDEIIIDGINLLGTRFSTKP